MIDKVRFYFFLLFVQFNSVAQSCPTLCDPMNHSTPGLPVHHQLPEFTQTHVHQDASNLRTLHSTENYMEFFELVFSSLSYRISL